MNSLVIDVTSEHPERLTAFYRDVVGLPKNPEIGEGAFDAGATAFVIDGHSETKGTCKKRWEAYDDEDRSRSLLLRRAGGAEH